MRAELKRLHSPDIYDLARYSPKNPDDFGFLLQAMIGPAGATGEESFDIVVCTPTWLRRTHHEREIISGRHHLIVSRYNYLRLATYITEFVSQCSGQTWQEVATRLCRLGKREFEADQEPPALDS